MIIRARPKYIQNIFFKLLDKPFINDNNIFYFNQGRSGLLFILNIYKKYLHKELLVALQAFNCSSVMDAVLQSKSKAVLLENNLNDFSISISSISSLKSKPDVLILTHYQGIPNQEYEIITEYCANNDIFIIEDASQTYGSSINNINIGSRCNILINSFSFDKPLTAMYGGSISLINLNKKLRENIEKEYSKLKFENEIKSNNDIKALKISLKYSESDSFCPDLDRTIIENFCYIPLFYKFIIFFTKYKFLRLFLKTIYKVFSKIKSILNKQKKIKILRLSPRKQKLINLQQQNYKYNNEEVKALEKYLGIKERFPNSNIHWNRYSLLDISGELKNKLDSNVECGNYNWSVPLHIIYKDNINVISNNEYPNAELCSKKILNIPIWSNYFQNIVRTTNDNM